ncbi:ABC transporter ATP-binding protein [Aquamicrobium terrae]
MPDIFKRRFMLVEAPIVCSQISDVVGLKTVHSSVKRAEGGNPLSFAAETASKKRKLNDGEEMTEELNPFVRFEQISKTYDGDTLVIEDLDLDIMRGEFLTLLGPSGSGKTTALMMLAGFESPTSGRILVEGRPIHHVPPYKREIGVVFQNYALFPHLTIAENLSFPLSVRRWPAADIKSAVDQALDMVQLGKMAGRKPNQLSGGQQQRVALARALIFQPRLVLMDEPLGALDKNLREEMQNEIRTLHGNLGINVVYVTHDQSEALTMSTRVAVFKGGTIQQLSSARDLYEYPANLFVANFIGENNSVQGKVMSTADGCCTVELDDGQLARGQSVSASAANGNNATLSVRPERIAINPPDDYDTLLQGTVTEVVYHGDHFRVTLRGSGSNTYQSKVANTGGQSDIEPGQPIRFGWRTSDCRCFMGDVGC